MKTRIAIALSCVTILTAAAGYGQSGQSLGSADVPFTFYVGKKAMPAGRYQISKIKGEAEGQESRLLLQNWQAKTSVFVPVIERLAETDPAQKHGPRFVFDTVNDQRYLSEFWPPDKGDGFLLGINKGEGQHQIVEGK